MRDHVIVRRKIQMRDSIRGASTFTVVAAGAIAVIVIASGLYLAYLSPNRQTTGCCTTYLQSPLSGDSRNTTIGLDLKLSINSTLLATGGGIAVNITEANMRNVTNDVNASRDWPIDNLALGPCGTLNYPMGIGVFQGFYTQSNVSSAGKPLSIYQPGEYMCPMILSNIDSYQFGPLSDNAQIYGSCSSGSCFELNVTSEIDAGGYWSSHSSFARFSSGNYTVVGGDEWGQMVILHFTVAPGANFTRSTISSVSGHATSSSFDQTSGVMAYNEAYAYYDIPSVQFVGSFFVGMTTSNNSEYTFDFNVTTMAPKSTYIYFDWTPPCSSHLSSQCESDNQLVLPNPENATVVYNGTRLLILWYQNSTGLYISFQEYYLVGPISVTTATSYNVTSSCTVSSANLSETVKGANATTTFTTYTSAFNPCG
jgi:hypothetical protein